MDFSAKKYNFPSPWKWITIFVTFVLIILSFSANVLMRSYTQGRHPVALEGPWDNLFPIIPIFVIPYLSMLILAPFVTPLVSLLFGGFRMFLVAAYAIILQQVWLAIGFLLFASTRPHGPIPPSAPSLEALLKYAYCGIFSLIHACDSADLAANYNSFPSGHASMVAITTIAWFRLRRRFPVLTPLVIIWSGIILLSTLFMHEHFIVELYAGLAVGCLSYWTASMVIEKAA